MTTKTNTAAASEVREARPGLLVRIADKDNFFYQQGTHARLVEIDDQGDWWANFRNVGNPKGSFSDEIDGIWCIGPDRPTDFVVVDEASSGSAA